MRLNAYYYAFNPTGVEAIDRILSAVACAGKAFHSTDDWGDEVWDYNEAGEKVPAPYEPFLRGWTPVDWIQNAANDAARVTPGRLDDPWSMSDELQLGAWLADRNYHPDDDSAAAQMWRMMYRALETTAFLRQGGTQEP